MSKTDIAIKESIKEFLLCAYCIKIKGRSKKFKTTFALTWHTTHLHQDDIGIIDVSDVSVPKSSVIKREFRYED